jgi:MFS family permease
MSFLQSFLIGVVSAAAAALIGWWLARRWARPDEGSEATTANGWLEAQTGQRNALWTVAGLLAMMIVLVVFVGLVAAIWPFMEKWLYWLTAVASIGGYLLSFSVAWTLALLPDEFGQRGRLLSWAGLAVWTLTLLSLALGAYQNLYAHSLLDGMLDDLAARSMISVGAACALYAVTIVTGLQLTSLLVLAQAREQQALNGLARLVWQLTIYGVVMVSITTVAGFALASGLML